jgi:hypothetical protein
MPLEPGVGPIIEELTSGNRTGAGNGGTVPPVPLQELSLLSSEDQYAYFGSGQAPNFSKVMQEMGSLLNLDSSYSFDRKTFPSDLTADYNQHIMVININVQVKHFNSGQIRSIYSGNASGETGVSIGQSLSNDAGGLTKLEQAKLGAAGFNVSGGFIGPTIPRDGIVSNILGSISDTVNNVLNATTGLILDPSRNTKRIKESIALHMPTPLIFNHMNIYEEVSLTAFAAQLLKLAVAAGTTGPAAALFGLQSGNADRATNALGNIQGGARVVGGIASAIGTVAKTRGMPINPRIEILFAHTAQRVFDFELLMAPRNEKESKDAKNIIDTLRYHAAPEMESIAGVPLLIPPAEFDITFFHGGRENTTIPRINTCVMERIEVDYSSTGGIYATFSNGHPVTIRVSMRFREIEIPHKTRILQGF